MSYLFLSIILVYAATTIDAAEQKVAAGSLAATSCLNSSKDTVLGEAGVQVAVITKSAAETLNKQKKELCLAINQRDAATVQCLLKSGAKIGWILEEDLINYLRQVILAKTGTTARASNLISLAYEYTVESGDWSIFNALVR